MSRCMSRCMPRTSHDHASRAAAVLRAAMLWLLAACLVQSTGAAAQTPFQDPSGRFTITIAKGWTVANREPLVVTARDASVTVTTADGTDADAAVQRLLGQVEGQWSRWQELKRGTTTIGGQRAPLVFASGNNPKGVPAFFRISAVPAGNAVLVMMASVPQDRFADARPGIEAMEASIAIGGRPRAAEAPAPRTAAGPDKRLAALDKALEAGVLTQEEYDAKKRAIVGQGGAATPSPSPPDAGPSAAPRAWLGVASRNLEAQDQQALRIRQGALVEQIAPGSPAEAAGIQPGDVIVAIEGAAIADAQSLIQTIARRRPGDAVAIRIFRQGQTGEVQTRLVAAPQRQ